MAILIVILLGVGACTLIALLVGTLLLPPESIGRTDPEAAALARGSDATDLAQREHSLPPPDATNDRGIGASASAHGANASAHAVSDRNVGANLAHAAHTVNDRGIGASESAHGGVHGRDEHRLLTERDPRGLAPELGARGEPDVGGEYQPGQESYELFVPARAAAGEPHGILVWISSDPTGAIPIADWRTVLAARKLAWAGPNQVGNNREVALRIGLALDALRDAQKRFTLDPRRVYVGGLSGGAKSAFRAQLYYPDVFQGALLAAGVEYFRSLPAPSQGKSAVWPQRIGKPRDLAFARLRPVAITTGPNDFNLGHITDVAAGMREDAFTRVQVFSGQSLGHAPPPAELFERAVRWLDAARE